MSCLLIKNLMPNPGLDGHQEALKDLDMSTQGIIKVLSGSTTMMTEFSGRELTYLQIRSGRNNLPE